MKKVLLLIALAAASSVCAQAPEPAREPATLPATEAAKAPATSTVARRSRRMQDARHCLERPTNTEIIKCAEAYL